MRDSVGILDGVFFSTSSLPQQKDGHFKAVIRLNSHNLVCINLVLPILLKPWQHILVRLSYCPWASAHEWIPKTECGLAAASSFAPAIVMLYPTESST
jgi:hypothetical protein